MPIKFRIRWREGLEMLSADDDWTVSQFLQLIKDKTGYEEFTVKDGWPPRDLDLSNPEQRSLASLGLDGKSLMVQATAILSAETAAKAAPIHGSGGGRESVVGGTTKEEDEPPTMVEKAAGMAVDWPERGGSLSTCSPNLRT
jgi:hypothetical protein